jgi:histidyl-tRNA synthetase
MSQPSIPKGTRDFGPEVMRKRNYIFEAIRSVFELFGYQPMETPSMENLETLTGKYGEEGDQLIFKILNNGDYLKDVDSELLKNRDSKKLVFQLCDRALRYDLTVPFARYVAMNKNSLSFPFKRYQIQPVWRADRPQKGRYREFYQCDVDVVGSNSLLHEVEFIQIFDQVLGKLNIPAVVHLNNRKILSGIAEVAGCAERLTELTVVIDKLDKIGEEGVLKELTERSFDEMTLAFVKKVLGTSGTNPERLSIISELLHTSDIGKQGLQELQYVLDTAQQMGLDHVDIVIDTTLARGLNYYTGAIFEVKAINLAMGSICGGGRYDDLTGIFGEPGLSGVGISFGADRIFDVMSELNLFPMCLTSGTQVLITNFGEKEQEQGLRLLRSLRKAGVASELYPDSVKMKKQFKYADDKKIPFVLVIGEQELASNTVSMKNMVSGEQVVVTSEEAIARLSS